MSAHLTLCKPHFVRLHADRVRQNLEVINIDETSAEGSGTISFSTSKFALSYQNRTNKPPIHWLLQGKCADGAFIIFDEDQAHLHIVELKSKLIPKEWKKACEQFEGMLLNSFAMAGIIELSVFDSITCYIAFSEDAISVSHNASPVLYKNLPGMVPQRHGLTEWLTSAVTLLSKYKANLIKIQRDAGGNASYNLP